MYIEGTSIVPDYVLKKWILSYTINNDNKKKRPKPCNFFLHFFYNDKIMFGVGSSQLNQDCDSIIYQIKKIGMKREERSDAVVFKTCLFEGDNFKIHATGVG